MNKFNICFALLLSFFIFNVNGISYFPNTFSGSIGVDLNANSFLISYNSIENYYTGNYDLINENNVHGNITINLDNILNTRKSNDLFYDNKKVGTANFINTNIINISILGLLDSKNCFLEEDKNLFCIFSIDLIDESYQKTNLKLTYSIDNFNSNKYNYNLNNNLDYLNLDLSNLDTNPDSLQVIEYFKGEVLYSDKNHLLKGELKIVHNKKNYFYEIIDGSFGEDKPIIIDGFKGDEVSFYVNGILLDNLVLSNNEKENYLELILSNQKVNFGFFDSDRDGIPDKYDQCPNSKYKTVDKFGCDSKQIKCSNNDIIIGNYEVKCSNIDCDGEECNDEDFKSEDKVINNCQISGCQDDFICQKDGSCKMSIELEGLRCKINDYSYGDNINCLDNGNSWIEEDKSQYFTLDVSGFSLIKKYIKKKIQKEINKVSLCVNTMDLGCNVKQATCPGKDLLSYEKKEEASEVVEAEFNGEVDSQIPSFLGSLFGIDVKIDVDLTVFDFEVHENLTSNNGYTCEPQILDANDACKALIKNGDSDTKLDLLVIGDGFENQLDLENFIHEVMDYDGENYNTLKQGIFSIEPFKSNKEKFNIWYLDSKGEINYGPDLDKLYDGMQPDKKDIYQLANLCPWYDYALVLSRKNLYRSNCGLGKPGFCRISVFPENGPQDTHSSNGDSNYISEGGGGKDKESTSLSNNVDSSYATESGGGKDKEPTSSNNDDDTGPGSDNMLSKNFGMLVAHEFGHGLGLADEYFILIDSKNNEEEFDISALKTGENCISEESDARDKWGNLVSNIGGYKSCGGDNTQAGESFIRPTLNSIMRYESSVCSGESKDTCVKGPPYPTWDPVNEAHLIKIFNEYN